MKNSKVISRLFLVLSFLIILFLLSGCFLFETTKEPSQAEESISLSSEVEEVASDENEPEVGNTEETAPAEEEDGEAISEGAIESTEDINKLNVSTITIKVYYVDEQAQYLIGEEREISGKTKEELVVAAFGELLKGPQSENIYKLIPEGTKIIGAECVDNYVVLNLSKEFIENRVKDGLADFLVLNCISATLTEIPDIRGVLFEIEGERINVYGTLDVSTPVKRNEDLLE